ncbi:MAG TPA: hypothetical protein VGV38_05860, partial [Pyrinomonadaceae bacterium]|nr:hypothetical protein [Pyrinomonadaceae bacterium]
MLAVLLATLLLSNVAALAQTGKSAAQQQQSASTVSAKVTAGGLRFVSTDGAAQIRLELYSAAGERLFDSNFREGGILDWKVEDVVQGLAEGSYRAVVSVKDLQGRVRRQHATVSLGGGRVSVQAAGKGHAEAAQASEAQADGVGLGDDLALNVLPEGSAQAVTVSAHDGQDGQLTSTGGALTFRTGDVFSGKEAEHMRLTPDGRVGIGTDKPEATLDVAGTIRARGGIVFDDGSVLTSAAGAKGAGGVYTSSVVSAGDNNVTANASGTGTLNKIAKWTDAAGTLGDSVLSESNGNISVGGTNATYKLSVGSTANAADGIVARNQGNTNAVSQLRLEMKEPTGDVLSGFDIYSKQHSIVDRRGEAIFWTYNTSGFTVAAQDATSFFRVVTGGTNFTANERFRITPAGNVGIGTPAPSQKLEVAGSVKLSGAGSAIYFPDGTAMTTAPAGGNVPADGTSIINAINNPMTAGVIADNHVSPNVARLNASNVWASPNLFSAGLSTNGSRITDVGNPVNAGDAVNKAYTDANFVKFVPGAEQLSVGDANGTAPLINLRGGSTCCSGPGGHTP